MKDNPYQAPKATSTTTTGEAGLPAYQDPLAGYLVINKEFEPPNVCLFTGEVALPEISAKKVQVVYIPRFYQIGIFIAILGISFTRELFESITLPAETSYITMVLILTQFIFRKHLTLRIVYGESIKASKSKRQKFGILFLALLPVWGYATYVNTSSENFLSALIPVFGFVFSLIYGLGLLLGFPKRLKVKKYKDGYFFVKGVHPSVLEKYPHLPEKLI